MIADNIAAGVVIATVLISTWDEKNNWKSWCLLIVATIALTFTNVLNHAEGYNKGLDDGQCLMAKVIDMKPDIRIDNMKDYCK